MEAKIINSKQGFVAVDEFDADRVFVLVTKDGEARASIVLTRDQAEALIAALQATLRGE